LQQLAAGDAAKKSSPQRKTTLNTGEMSVDDNGK
jgi:hypothetical protein